MRGAFSIYIMVVWAIGFTIVVALFIVDERIIEHIFRKEGRRYPTTLLGLKFDTYWFFRRLSPSFFNEAREAGYYKIRLALVIAFVGLMVGSMLLGQLGLTPKPPPPLPN